MGRRMSEVMAPPKIDRRSADDIAAAVQYLLACYSRDKRLGGAAPGWQATTSVLPQAALGRVLFFDAWTADGATVLADAGTFVSESVRSRLLAPRGPKQVTVLDFPNRPEPGLALISVFAHLAGLVVDRLNRTPDKAFLAFLDLIGVTPLPPQPARVPLTFYLAGGGGSGEVRVPAGTQVAAVAVEDEASPPVFETVRDLFPTRASLIAAYVREPAAGLWSDARALISGSADGVYIFEGYNATETRLWIDDRRFAGRDGKTLTLDLVYKPETVSFPAIAWQWWDGRTLQPLKASAVSPPGRGTVSFSLTDVPPVPAAAAVGTSGHWLCGSLSPAQSAIAPGSGAPLTVTSIAVAGSLPATAALPKAVLSNSVEIDTSKDFLPFGERPRLGDALAVTCDDAFMPGGVQAGDDHMITLAWTASDLPEGRLPAPDPLAKPEPEAVTLAWEYWDGEQWKLIAKSTFRKAYGSEGKVTISTVVVPTKAYDPKFVDNTVAFMAMIATEPKTVSFRRPPNWAPSSIGGITGCWLRIRVAAGGYGRDGRYLLKTAGKPEDGYLLEPATWRPPSLCGLSLNYQYTAPASAPGRVMIERDFAFTHVTSTDVTNARQENGTFVFPIATVANIPSALPSSQPALYLGFQGGANGQVFTNQPVSLYVAVVDQRLDGDSDRLTAAPAPPVVTWEYWNGGAWTHLGVDDGTRGFVERGLVTFLGPVDFKPSTEFGQSAYWLRARWESGGYIVPPRVARILTNTTWAEQRVSTTEVLGSGTGEPNQSFRTVNAPILGDQSVDVCEVERPTGVTGGSADTATDSPSGGYWVRWQEVDDFNASDTGSRHYVVDREGGGIRFGDGSHGRNPPRGSGNIRMTYRSGGGTVGNRPAGTVTQLKSALPYVASVTNHDPAGGGSDFETMASVRRRGPATLRHRWRAVAAADFEDLAFEASSAVTRAKVSTASGAPGGVVGVTVVPQGTERNPTPTLELLRRVETFIRTRALPTVELRVRGPEWCEISVTAEVVPVSLDRSVAVRAQVLAALETFLHPLTGGRDGRGWPFGRAPQRSDLCAVVQSVPGVDHIRQLSVAPEIAGMQLHDHTLICSGNHQVTLGQPLSSTATTVGA